MNLPSCLFDAQDAFTLGLCKPLGLGVADWAKLFGVTIVATLAWLYRAFFIPAIILPFKKFARRKNRNWPRLTNEQGRTQRQMIGRLGALERLHEILTAGSLAAITNQRAGVAAVHGQGGVGKSFTTYAYVARYRSEYQTIWIIPAEAIESIHESLAQLGAKIEFQKQGNPDPKSDSIDILRAASNHHAPVLVIFDNVILPKDIQPYLVETDRFTISLLHDMTIG